MTGRVSAVRRRRLGLLDAIIAAAAIAVVVYVVYRINTYLVYNWDWERLIQFFVRFDATRGQWVPNLLIEGIVISVRVCFWGAVMALAIGLVMGLCRVSNALVLRQISRGYVELVRNMAPVPFFFIAFFFVGNQLLLPLELDSMMREASPETRAVVDVLFGQPNLLRNFIAAAIALALYDGAYITEIVRAGVQSIERGQWEAANSLGLSRYHVLRHVVLPQAVQRITPPLTNQSIQLVKDSALVSLLSIQELTFMGQEIAHSTTRFFETWIIVAALYFVACYGLSRLYGRIERRMKRGRTEIVGA